MAERGNLQMAATQTVVWQTSRVATRRNITTEPSFSPADARYLTLHKGHLMFVRPDEDRFATPELIQGMTVSGSASELRDRMRRLKAAGYDEIVVQVTPGCENMMEDWARVFETV